MDRRIIIGLLMLLAASCHKTEVSGDVVSYIRLNTNVVETRSLVESSEELKAAGNTLTMYDVHTKADGNLIQYMENQTLKYTDGQWQFMNDTEGVIDIPWTKQGQHHFMACLSGYDSKTWNNSGLEVTYAPGSGTAEDQKITVSADLSTSNQFDFLYASYARDVVTEGTGTVPLQMEHLFSAVQFQVMNMSGSNMTVNSFAISGLKTNASAEIGFGSNPVITFDSSQNSENFTVTDKNISSTIGTVDKLHEGAFLIWPHRPDYYKYLKCTFIYTLGSGSSSTVEVYLTAADADVTSWDAGSRYIYTITVSDHILFDVVKVVDWINDDVILKE